MICLPSYTELPEGKDQVFLGSLTWYCGWDWGGIKELVEWPLLQHYGFLRKAQHDCEAGTTSGPTG